MREIGKTTWAIAEGYIPGRSSGPEPAMTSHETACILNAGERDARVTLTVYFRDRDPARPYEVTVPARRTVHLRFNDVTDPEPVPARDPVKGALSPDDSRPGLGLELERRDAARFAV